MLVSRRITDKNAIESIIQQALVCRIAMSDGGQPYAVPVCFGYEDNPCTSTPPTKAGNWTC
jgi:nitroimidazol reductase NimA-like FMN-containing flavoprotein (pyridoxamine 5'-phosphate oxidase superfamily)